MVSVASLDCRDMHAQAPPAAVLGPGSSPGRRPRSLRCPPFRNARRPARSPPTTLPQVPAFPQRPPPRPEPTNTPPPTSQTAARHPAIRPPPHNWHEVVCALRQTCLVPLQATALAFPFRPPPVLPWWIKAHETRSRTSMSEQDKAGVKPGATSDPKSDAKRQAALQGALTQIERQFGKGTVMRMGDPGRARGRRRDPDRRAGARHRARDRRRPARPDHRDLRPGVVGQDDARLPHPRRGPEARRRVRVRRRRARDGPAVRPADRASTSTSCWSRSPTTASRRWRSSTC